MYSKKILHIQSKFVSIVDKINSMQQIFTSAHIATKVLFADKTILVEVLGREIIFTKLS